ncbi:12731_t:CDS:1, partial [Funneliformis geosporum]
FITVMLELLKPFEPTKIKCPIIVFGAEEDKAFDFKIINETTEAWSVGINIIGGSTHVRPYVGECC